MNLKHIAYAALAASSLAGCAVGSSKYSCGAPDGVTCMSPLELYSATDSSDRVRGKGAPATAGRPIAAIELDGQDELALEDGSLTFASMQAPARGVTPLPALPVESPLRAPAKVMRIWFAPYEDEHGDLHMPGHVFSEIEARRWAIGERAPELSAPLELMQPLKKPTGPIATDAVASAATGNTTRSERVAR